MRVVSYRVIMANTAPSRKVTRSSNGPDILPDQEAILHALQTSQSDSLSLQLPNDSIAINDAR